MELPVGAYFRHRHFGLGRVLSYDPDLFPRVCLRFEDGVDRVFELDPASPDAQSDPVHGASQLANPPRLTDGRTLDPVPAADPSADRVVFTVGYEGLALSDLIALLQTHRVGVLVDIRDAPVSRKHGFSKRELERSLRQADIGYILKREWGNPKRKADTTDARKSRVHALVRYTSHLAPQIVEAAAFVESVLPQRPAFLCYEQEPFHCHRSRFVALVMPHCQPQPQVHHILPAGA